MRKLPLAPPVKTPCESGASRKGNFGGAPAFPTARGPGRSERNLKSGDLIDIIDFIDGVVNEVSKVN